jgi:AraC-like DNA-binding protein/effector-binding domain-containing protein
MKKNSVDSQKYTLLWDALLFIEKKYNQNIHLENIASKSFYSKYHFQREFKNLFSFTPKEYLSLVRNQKAAILLLSTDIGIGDIGFEVGFENQKTFSRSFKKIFGITPIQYRKKFQNISKDTHPNLPFRIKNLPTKKILMIRSTKGVFGISKTISKLLDFALQNGVHSFESCLVGRFHEPPQIKNFKMNRVDMGIESPFFVDKEVRYPFYIETLPGGEYYSIYHFGSLKFIQDTYKTIFNTLKLFQTSVLRSIPYELYHRIPPFFSEEQSITEILILIEK